MKTKTKRNEKNSSFSILVVFLLLGLIIGGCYCFYQEFFNSDTGSVTVVSKMDDYPYYLNSNATRLYKKYYKLLEEELKDSKVDEKEYAKLVAQLFSIDFYTLSNKLTNQDIGGIQFISPSLQEKFSSESKNTVYKYIENNISGKRTQELPEVKKVEVSNIETVSYNKNNLSDSSAFKVLVELEYVVDLGYPESLELFFIHEDNKLVLVEFGEK